jgi:hypothetical protein
LKPKYLLMVCLVVGALCAPATGSAADAGGVWDANVMGAKIRAYVEQKGSQLSGVAKVRTPNGKRSTYHFAGSINGNQVQVAHYTGHSFSGTLTGPRKMVGVLKTRNGQSVSVTAKRR